MMTLDDDTCQKFIKALFASPRLHRLIAHELCSMVNRQGAYEDIDLVSPWAVFILFAAAEIIKQLDVSDGN